MKSISGEGIKSLIQEWFCDCTTLEETAQLYAELYHEVQNGMKERIEALTDNSE